MEEIFQKSFVKTEHDSELAFYDLQYDFSPVDNIHLTGSRRSMEEEILDAEAKSERSNFSTRSHRNLEEHILDAETEKFKELDGLASLSQRTGMSSTSRPMLALDWSNPRKKTAVAQNSTRKKKKSTRTRRQKRKWIKLEDYPSQEGRSLPWPRWQEVEDIFLHGVVLDTYSRRHSLKPFKEETKTGETIIWNQVHKRYKTACRRHFALTGEALGDRTVRAIQKRWKHGQHSDKSDIKIDESGCFVNPMPTYKRYQREWDLKYNINGILSCPEILFKEAYDNLFENLPETV